jgi:hypothetical protein
MVVALLGRPCHLLLFGLWQSPTADQDKRGEHCQVREAEKRLTLAAVAPCVAAAPCLRQMAC